MDARTDIYSLGVILYQLLAGQLPFTGSCEAVIHQILHQEPTPPSKIHAHIPPDLETICLKALAKQPAHRYRTAQEMAEDLRRFQSGEPILARRMSWTEKSWRWIARRPALAGCALLLVIALSSLIFVQRLASENLALLGLKTVSITTVPAGAKLTFAPIDETTGQINAAKIQHAAQRSPCQTELAPGDYLVVATLPDGRFHEVYRHVAQNKAELSGSFPHNHWKAEQGVFVLTEIRIPSATVTNGMALFPVTGKSTLPRQHGDEPAGFYMDCQEFTVSDYQKLAALLPHDTRWRKTPDQYAMTVSYDSALALAEHVGKRLPTEAEYDQASQHIAPNWNAADLILPTDFGPVGLPSEDQTDTIPPVFGLCSNVAEWTLSFGVNVDSGDQTFSITTGVPRDFRIIRGGDETVVEGNPTIAPEHRNPSGRFTTSAAVVKPGLGFRCVRSARPMFNTD